jgi:hypothetical protein
VLVPVVAMHALPAGALRPKSRPARPLRRGIRRADVVWPSVPGDRRIPVQPIEAFALAAYGGGPDPLLSAETSRPGARRADMVWSSAHEPSTVDDGAAARAQLESAQSLEAALYLEAARYADPGTPALPPGPGTAAFVEPGALALPGPGTAAFVEPGALALPGPSTEAFSDPAALARPEPGVAVFPEPGALALPEPSAVALPEPAANLPEPAAVPRPGVPLVPYPEPGNGTGDGSGNGSGGPPAEKIIWWGPAPIWIPPRRPGSQAALPPRPATETPRLPAEPPRPAVEAPPPVPELTWNPPHRDRWMWAEPPADADPAEIPRDTPAEAARPWQDMFRDETRQFG